MSEASGIRGRSSRFVAGKNPIGRRYSVVSTTDPPRWGRRRGPGSRSPFPPQGSGSFVRRTDSRRDAAAVSPADPSVQCAARGVADAVGAAAAGAALASGLDVETGFVPRNTSPSGSSASSKRASCLLGFVLFGASVATSVFGLPSFVFERTRVTRTTSPASGGSGSKLEIAPCFDRAGRKPIATELLRF